MKLPILASIAVAAMAAFSTVTSAATPDLAVFKDVQFEEYSDVARGITIDYPYLWSAQKKRSKQEIFRVADRRQLPSLAISVQPRMDALPFNQSATAATQALGSDVKILSHKEIDLGGTPAWEVTADWVLPIYGGLKLRSVLISVYRGDEWIIISGTDGRTVDGLYPLLAEALQSARFSAPAAQKGDDQ